MSVIVERNGPVTTLVIARPERRNAVDRPTAQAWPTPYASSKRTIRRGSRYSPAAAAISAPAPTWRR